MLGGRGFIAVGNDAFKFEFRFVFLDSDYARIARELQKSKDPVEYARSTLRFHRALQFAPLEKKGAEDLEEAFLRKDAQCPLLAFYRDRPRLLAFAYLVRYIDCLVRHARPKLPVCQELLIEFIDNEHLRRLSYFVSRFTENFDLDTGEARHAFVFLSKYHSKSTSKRKITKSAPSPLVISDFKRQYNKDWDGLEGAYVLYDAIVAYVYYMQRTYTCREIYNRIDKGAWDLALSASKRGGTEHFQKLSDHFNEWAMKNAFESVCSFKYTRFGYKLLHNLIVTKCASNYNRYAVFPINLGFRKQEERLLKGDELNYVPYFEKDSDYARYMLKKHKIGE